MEQQDQIQPTRQSGNSAQSEKRLALVHRVLIPDAECPREYAILITDQRSIFIRQPKTRSSFWLRGEMKWGTALVTDVVPKTIEDYENTSLETLSHEPSNFAVPHESAVSLVVKGDKPTFRAREFWIKWTMQRQKEIFQVYNFQITYRNSSDKTDQIKFYAVPLGAYFKPRRQTQTRQTILQEYAEDILKIYRAAFARSEYLRGSSTNCLDQLPGQRQPFTSRFPQRREETGGSTSLETDPHREISETTAL